MPTANRDGPAAMPLTWVRRIQGLGRGSSVAGSVSRTWRDGLQAAADPPAACLRGSGYRQCGEQAPATIEHVCVFLVPMNPAG